MLEKLVVTVIYRLEVTVGDDTKESGSLISMGMWDARVGKSEERQANNKPQKQNDSRGALICRELWQRFLEMK